MFNLCLAGHTFAVYNQCDYVKNLCRDYRVSTPGDVVIAASDEEIFAEGSRRNGKGYLESLAVYRKICELLVGDGIILFHSSALAMGGKAILFAAPSGTGKSTHARLWRERFGPRVLMVNDDKPLLKVDARTVTVYGTPYGGKDNIQTNTSAPVAAIVMLHQAGENSIRCVTPAEAYPLLLNQTYRPRSAAGLAQTLPLVNRLTELPLFSLGCTISQDAVSLVYDTLKGEGILS